MELYPHINVDERHKLTISGIEATKLARRFGTPLYVYSEDALIKRMSEYVSAMAEEYPGGVIAYASKAYLTVRMAELVALQGLWMDVSSGGELYIALRAGFPPEHIILHGNNKTFEELEMAVASGAGRIVIDNLDEMARLEAVAARLKKTQAVMLRLAPGIDAHTHRFLATGEIDSKFGVPMHHNQHLQAALKVLSCDHLKLTGFHCHIGSQIFETQPFLMAAKTMLNFLFEFERRTGVRVPELDLGGGLGVAYGRGERELSVREYVHAVASTVKSESAKLGLVPPRLFLEPGRSIVAKAGVTIYRVGSIKELPNGQVVAAVDGGMSDNPRPMLYGAKYEAILANRASVESPRPTRIVGKHCEEGDTLIEECWLPPLRPGDILVIPVSGAYQYSMSSNYNALRRPAVVHVRNGRPMLVVERQTYDSLVAGQRSFEPSPSKKPVAVEAK